MVFKMTIKDAKLIALDQLQDGLALEVLIQLSTLVSQYVEILLWSTPKYVTMGRIMAWVVYQIVLELLMAGLVIIFLEVTQHAIQYVETVVYSPLKHVMMGLPIIFRL